jgi:7tm Chemosensory receptor
VIAETAAYFLASYLPFIYYGSKVEISIEEIAVSLFMSFKFTGNTQYAVANYMLSDMIQSRVKIIAEVTKCDKFLEIDRERRITKINLLTDLLFKLRDSIQMYNKMFSIPILLAMGCNTFSETFSLFELFGVVVGLIKNSINIVFAIGFNLSIINILRVMFVLIRGFTKIISEIDEIRGNLYRVLIAESDAKVRRRIRLTLMQIDHSDIKFSSGLVVLNWRIVFWV